MLADVDDMLEISDPKTVAAAQQYNMQPKVRSRLNLLQLEPDAVGCCGVGLCGVRQTQVGLVCLCRMVNRSGTITPSSRA